SNTPVFAQAAKSASVSVETSDTGTGWWKSEVFVNASESFDTCHRKPPVPRQTQTIKPSAHAIAGRIDQPVHRGIVDSRWTDLDNRDVRTEFRKSAQSGSGISRSPTARL